MNTNNSIMEEISKIEQVIKSTYEQVATLEKRLERENLPENKRKMVQRELEDVRKLLKTHEEQLGHLRSHNRITFIFVAALIFLIFTVYVVYVLIWGDV